MNELENLRSRFGGHAPGLMGARHSYAVLCPLVKRPDGLHLLFEVRSAALRRQPGEVCFPGGRREEGESAQACALRETEEELAIPAAEVELLGMPDFICNQRGFLLQPVLGLVSPAGFAEMRPSPVEVAEVFTVPLDFFRRMPPELYHYDLTPAPPKGFPYGAIGVPENYPWGRGTVEVPVWYWQGHAIWGMTARIVKELVR